ncbi:hypothetical protein IC582_000124 [Cucumis melo]
MDVIAGLYSKTKILKEAEPLPRWELLAAVAVQPAYLPHQKD